MNVGVPFVGGDTGIPGVWMDKDKKLWKYFINQFRKTENDIRVEIGRALILADAKGKALATKLLS